MSNAAAFFAASLCWTKHAIAGIGWSGVTVATTITSTSLAEEPAAASACRAASTQKSERTSPSPATRRSLIPVRVVIQSSVVSSIFSRSAFVSTRAGRARPVPAMAVWNIQPPCSARPAAGANSRAFLRIFSGIPRLEKSLAARMAFRTAFALERPWPMRQAPFTPSSGAPPYSL